MNDTQPAHGLPLFEARFKLQAVDFQVDEVLNLTFDGAGEHLYLFIEKRSTNTDEVASLLEKCCAVRSVDIGLSGLKDRHAITRQWFSVRTSMSVSDIAESLEGFNQASSLENNTLAQLPLVGGDSQMPSEAKQLRLLDSTRHSRKLRRGTHTSNEFTVVLRHVKPLDESGAVVDSEPSLLRSAVNERLHALATYGFPNYIGPQRFGLGGQNLVRARQWFSKPKKRSSRQQRSLWLSAARSALFNDVCAQRVRADSWCTLLPGEPAMLDGSSSFFDSTDADSQELDRRLASFDIHPSAPWWGRGRSLAVGECESFEQGVLSSHADLCSGLERAGLPQARRALRARAANLTHSWLDDASLKIRFQLPPGVFATTVLSELGHCMEPTRGHSLP